jgi:hypothetical protein
MASDPSCRTSQTPTSTTKIFNHHFSREGRADNARSQINENRLHHYQYQCRFGISDLAIPSTLQVRRHRTILGIHQKISG